MSKNGKNLNIVMLLIRFFLIPVLAVNENELKRENIAFEKKCQKSGSNGNPKW